MSTWRSAGTVLVLPSLIVCVPFPFGVRGRMWNQIVSVPDYCLSSTLESVSVILWTFYTKICIKDFQETCTDPSVIRLGLGYRPRTASYFCYHE